MTGVGRGTLLLVALCIIGVVSGCAAVSSGKSGQSSPLGCVDLGNAELGFKAADDGVTNGTVVDSDLAKQMGSIQGHLQTASEVSPSGVFGAATNSAAIYAGRARVALLSGDETAAATNIGRLRVQINRADPFCSASN